MTHHFLRILLLSTISLASLAASASAATPAQIHRDAADGSIDGEYSLADLKAADREVTSEQREYFGWEDAYREHVRQLTMPAPAPAPSRRPSRESDSSTNQPSPRDAGTKRETSSRTANSTPRSSRGADKAPRGERDSSPSSSVAGDDEDTIVSAAADSKERSVTGAGASDAGVAPVWLIALVPMLIGMFGAWRLLRTRRTRVAARAPQRD